MPLYEVIQSKSRRPIVVVQAEDIPHAFERARLVVDTLDLSFDPLAENWIIREAAPPYESAAFADEYFQLLGDEDSSQIH